MEELTAAQAAALLKESPDQHLLLDVREAQELVNASVAGALHIPMGEIPNRLEEIDRNRTIICLCHSGARSANVAQFLLAQGFEHAVNLTGGIQAWASDVDADVVHNG